MNGGAFGGAASVRRLGRAALLASLVLLVAACSSMRLAYRQADTLVYWWMDGYVDFERDQKPQAKTMIARWLAWHRQSQLPQYRQWLQQTGQLMRGEPTGEQICARIEATDPLRAQALAPLAGPVAELAPRLQPAQWRRLERRFNEKNAEWAEKYMQRDLQARGEATAERTFGHLEQFYGRLNPQQKAWVARQVALSPWRPENDLSERRLRQRDALATLQALAQPGLGAEQGRVVAAALLARLAAPVDVPHAQARDAARRFLCEMAAEFHREHATPEQRRHVVAVLQGWEGDVGDLLLAPPREAG